MQAGGNHGKLISTALAAIVVGVSATLVLITYYITANPETVPLEWQWNLRWEHNFAAWWGGSLLLLTALLTFDNALGAPNVKLKRAWLTLACIILFLSLDEVGSLHERMGSISKSLDAGRWALAIPLALVIAYLSIRSGLTLLWHGGRERLQILIIGIGFAVLLSVAFQEYVENAMDWRGSEWRPLRAAIEEGSELLGISIVLFAVSLPFWQRPGATLDSVKAHATPAMIAAIILVLPFLAISMDTDPQKGEPSDWLASALLLGTAFLWAKRAWTHGPVIGSLALAGIAGIASIAAVAMGPVETFELAGLELNRRGLIYAILALGLAAFVRTQLAALVLIAPAALLIAQAVIGFSSPFWPFLLGPVCALGIFAVSAKA
ncbi:hypothetical protein [Altererythrobacter lutimaris]|uniref:Uncharacterized protein n=1 Tax=Altererythrobacter lutimaris TaxID=2743979 RepID=A0A850HDR2_9SPHN|nr:hypothetical protein [Altererythrobacter lutimaris]NVE94898.1 hypothetical protein [Altererythrobacter lutimaris]